MSVTGGILAAAQTFRIDDADWVRPAPQTHLIFSCFAPCFDPTSINRSPILNQQHPSGTLAYFQFVTASIDFGSYAVLDISQRDFVGLIRYLSFQFHLAFKDRKSVV